MLLTAAMLGLIASVQRTLFGCTASSITSYWIYVRLRSSVYAAAAVFSSPTHCTLHMHATQCKRRMCSTLEGHIAACRQSRATSALLSAMSKSMMPSIASVAAIAPPQEGDFRFAAAESAHPILSRAVAECVQVRTMSPVAHFSECTSAQHLALCVPYPQDPPQSGMSL